MVRTAGVHRKAGLAIVRSWWSRAQGWLVLACVGTGTAMDWCHLPKATSLAILPWLLTPSTVWTLLWLRVKLGNMFHRADAIQSWDWPDHQSEDSYYFELKSKQQFLPYKQIGLLRENHWKREPGNNILSPKNHQEANVVLKDTFNWSYPPQSLLNTPIQYVYIEHCLYANHASNAMRFETRNHSLLCFFLLLLISTLPSLQTLPM